MNIVVNEALVKRNTRIAQFTMLGGLLVLVVGMVISFTQPEQFTISLGALMVGFLLSQIGIYFSNRWGRRPRPDEVLSTALKGLDKKYTLYHYTTPVSHLLVGPAGVWVLLPYHQRGTILYRNGRWRQKGGNIYMKIFAQEGLGRPDLEVMGEMSAIHKFFKEKLPEEQIPPVQAALVFTNPRVDIQIDENENPPAATVPASKLKDLVRKEAKGKTLSPERVRLIQEAIAS